MIVEAEGCCALIDRPESGVYPGNLQSELREKEETEVLLCPGRLNARWPLLPRSVFHLSSSRPHLRLPSSCPAVPLPAAQPSALITHMSPPMLTLALLHPAWKCFRAQDNSWLPVPSATTAVTPRGKWDPSLPPSPLPHPGQHHCQSVFNKGKCWRLLMLHQAETWVLCVTFRPALSQQRHQHSTTKALIFPVQHGTAYSTLSLTKAIVPTSKALQNYEQFPIWALS